MEIRTINGRPATDRAGAAERLGRSPQTIALWASPKQRAHSGFPASIGKHDGRDWYALDDLDTFAEILHQRQQTSPHRAPGWLRDKDPDELLPATDFRRAAGVPQGTWKRWVQVSVPAWDADRDGYLPRPDDQEPYRNTGMIYKWTARRMVHWLDHRPGERTGAGRKPGATPTVDDAIHAIQAADGQMTASSLAQALGISLRSALRLLRLARQRLDDAPK